MRLTPFAPYDGGMPNYRRAFVAGGSWFFTVNLLDRRSRLLVEQIEALREAVSATRHRFPFQIDAMVVLPDHLHAVWTLPDNDFDFSLRWRLIKVRFSKSMPTGERLTETRRARGERGIWQRRYWEHLIRDERDYRHHIDYCRSSTGSWPTSRIGRSPPSISICRSTPPPGDSKHSKEPLPNMRVRAGRPATVNANRRAQ